MSDAFTEVSELPKVNITTKPPALSGSQKFWTLGIGGKAETCFVACILATIAGRNGNWVIVQGEEFWLVAGEENGWRTFRQNMFPILGQLHRSGIIQLVRYHEKTYIVPTQALADIITAPGQRPFAA